MRELMTVMKALADESRVRMLLSLSDGELCVCQIVELMGLAPSTVSKHMSILKQAYLVDSRKEGRWMFYRLVEKDAPPEAQRIAALVSELAVENSRIRDDVKRIKQIMKMDKEQLCQKQNRC